MHRGPFRGLDEKMFRQRPTLPPRYQGSTIGAGGLNFRVRNGTGCFPSAIATETVVQGALTHCTLSYIASVSEPRPRPISTGRLHTLPCFHLRPINPLA